jgi:hypothetical protein
MGSLLKKKSGAVWFFGAKVLVHGKRFGQWAVVKKLICGQLEAYFI